MTSISKTPTHSRTRVITLLSGLALSLAAFAQTTATAEGAAPAAAEPEVIKKGKKEEEGAAPEKKGGEKKK